MSIAPRGLKLYAAAHTDLDTRLFSPDLEPWKRLAVCSQTDPEIFYVDKGGGDTRPARRVCADCPVKAECLQDALDREDRHGIWGGFSEKERRRIRFGLAVIPTLRDKSTERNVNGHAWACRCTDCRNEQAIAV